MKKLCMFFVLAVLAVGLFAGGAKESDKGTPAAKPAPKQIVMRLAETHVADYPTTRGNVEFARLVGERTQGRIKIDVYHSSQLGEEKAVIEQVQFGAIDFTRVSISPLAAFSKNFDALQMPYLYRNADHMWKVLNGPIGEEFLNGLAPANFVGMCWYDSGSRNFYNSKREIKSAADLKGLKIRVQQSELMMNMVSSLGAIPTPMPFGEVYSALQTGVIEGAENNWPSYISTSHYEVAKFFTLDEHTRVPEITIGSKIVLDKLAKEDQALIKKAAKDSMPYQIAEWAKEDKLAEEKARKAGNKITVLASNADFQAAMKPMYDKLSPELQALVKRIRDVQ